VKGVATFVKAGTPTDTDWPQGAPPIGTAVLDTTNSKIWYRVASNPPNGVWKGVAIA
jgi:hypothetical protein